MRIVVVGLAFVGLAAVDAYASAKSNEGLREFGLDALALPVVGCSYLFGRRGAAVAVAVAALISGTLFAVGNAYSTGTVVISFALFAVLGLIVGVSIDRDRASARLLARQLRVMNRRHQLSLDLLATMEDGRFVEANPVWLRKLGYPAEDLIGREFIELVHPDDRAQAMASREQLARSGEVTAQAVRIQHADGHYRWIEWSAQHDHEEGKNYVAGRDITAKREAEQTLLLHREMLERSVAERTADLQKRTEELERTTRELGLERRDDLRRLAMLAEFRDDKTAQHTERVGIASALIARELGLLEREIQLLREAAPLHDIGKIGTPDAILLTPLELNEAERTLMQQHARLGCSLLRDSNAPVLRIAAIVALSHHEWWDGSGYPDGLAGELIPLEARIVAVADVFDALTHDRPYKPAWPLSDAVAEIKTLSGRQFDPRVVEAFGRIPTEHLIALLEPDRTSVRLAG